MKPDFEMMMMYKIYTKYSAKAHSTISQLAFLTTVPANVGLTG